MGVLMQLCTDEHANHSAHLQAAEEPFPLAGYVRPPRQTN